MAKSSFGSMVKEATKQMTRGMSPQSMAGFPGKSSSTGMSKRKAYGKGGKKGRHQYGKTMKGYADPLD